MSYKMNKVLGFKEWKLFENEGETPTKATSLLVGATNHTAYNKSAGKKVNSDTAIEIEGVDGLSDAKAISRKTGTSIKKFTVVEKSEKAKDYLKIGDIILNGDGGNVEKVKVSLRELLTNDLEASGNGIYALCRAIEYAYKYKIGQGMPIHIVLNQPSKTPVVMFASTKKSLGSPMPGWNGMIHVVSTIGGKDSVITPAKANMESDKYTQRYSKKPYDNMSEIANKFPTPKILAPSRDEVMTIRKDMIANSTQFDISEWANTNKGKREREGYKALKIMQDFCKKHFKQYVNAEADRYIYYLDSLAKKAGVDTEVMSDIKVAAEAWRTKFLKNEKGFLNMTERIVEQLFRKVNYTTVSVDRTGASAETKDLEIGGF